MINIGYNNAWYLSLEISAGILLPWNQEIQSLPGGEYIVSLGEQTYHCHNGEEDTVLHHENVISSCYQTV
jgi:hypothetical protein